MANISIDQLADEITQAVKDYTEDVSEGVSKAVEDTANKILKDVKANAKHYGWSDDYVNGFAKNNQSKGGNKKYVIWNKKHYRRVHLLEKGHVLRQGGRARAYPHMFPAERENIPKFEEVVERIIKSGGGGGIK